jgi:hypothetical protein
MKQEGADARGTFIAVSGTGAEIFPLPLPSMVRLVIADHKPYRLSSETRYCSGGGSTGSEMDVSSGLLAFLLALPAFIRLLLTYLDLDKQRTGVTGPLKAYSPAVDVYERELLVPLPQIQGGLDFLKGFLRKIVIHIRQLMK